MKHSSNIIPILTVMAAFAAVAVIMTSILSKRAESPKSSTDAQPMISEPADTPPDTEPESTADAAVPVTESESESETETAPPPVQTIPVGIYSVSGKNCTLIDEFASDWPDSDDDPLWTLDTWTYKDHINLICDIDYFAVITSNEEKIKVTTWDETWLDRWEAAGLDDSYKVGFELAVYKKSGGEPVRITVLSPTDTFDAEEYFELYLYDCVAHAHDKWYSHITEKTNYDDTKNVMIKITLRDGCYDVDHIELTSFVYNSPDEFDENGFYTGANRATIIVKRDE